MGIWDALHSMADALKQRLPDPAPVKDACRSAYGLGRAAVGSIDTAVRGDATRAAVSRVDQAVVEGVRRIRESMPDRDGWVKIGRIAWNLTDLAVDQFTRPYTGGLPAYRMVKEELVKKDGKAVDHVKEDHEELQEMRKRIECLEKVVRSRM